MPHLEGLCTLVLGLFISKGIYNFFFFLFLLVVGKVSMYKLYGDLQTVWQICNKKIVILIAR